MSMSKMKPCNDVFLSFFIAAFQSFYSAVPEQKRNFKVRNVSAHSLARAVKLATKNGNCAAECCIPRYINRMNTTKQCIYSTDLPSKQAGYRWVAIKLQCDLLSGNDGMIIV